VYNLNNVANALGPVSQCGPGTTHPDCVPLNLFGGQYQGGTITPAMLNYITYTSQNTSANSLRDLVAKLDTDIADLPAGPLQAQLTYEFFSQAGSSTPDPLAAAARAVLVRIRRLPADLMIVPWDCTLRRQSSAAWDWTSGQGVTSTTPSDP